MPRNSSGTMSLPSPGVPFQSGQTISSAQVNATLSDLASETTSSLDRGGRGGMTAPLRTPNGSAAIPAHSYTSEPATGEYLAAAGDLRLAVGGVDALKLVAGGLAELNLPSTAGFGPVVQATGANKSLGLQGNRDAADTAAADVVVGSKNARTAGLLVDVQNPVNVTSRLQVDWQGLLRLANTAALQPASIWTAITPDTNIAASRGLAYTKDAVGKVHIRGVITNNTGGNIFNVNGTNPLPPGFRPLSERDFATPTGNMLVSAAGVISFFVAFPAGATAYLDAISFFPEQ
jgi:hypothetical protein